MADAPHEGGGTVSMVGTAGGSSVAGAATGGGSTDESPRPRLEGGFERALSLVRIVVIVPVIVLLASAVASFAYGTDVFVRSVTSFVEKPELTGHNLGF